MSEYKERIEEALSGLRQMRDELKVKIHLGKAEAQTEWDELEGKWQELKARGKMVGEEAAESAKDVSSALEIVAEELKKGYERIRKLL
jgi:hypothetical protein